MAERNERGLPADANIRLLQIFKVMHALKDSLPPHETLTETKKKQAKKLKEEAAWLRVKIRLLQKKLAAQETEYKTHHQLLLMITALNQLHKAAPPQRKGSPIG